jgi:hypothetical protein
MPTTNARRRPGLAAKLLLVGGAVAVTALLAEFAVRALMSKGRLLSPTAVATFAARAEAEQGMIRADDELGHAPVLGGPVYDEHGLLRTFPLRAGVAKQPDLPRLLFLGDSVTRRASLVAPLRTFAAATGQACEVLNAGVESWNPVQEVAGYFRSQQPLAADHVVVSLHNNDLTESTVMCLRDGALTLCNPGSFVPVDPAWYGRSILYQLYVHGRHTDRLRPEHYLCRADAVEAALARLRDEVKGRGARLSILVLPVFAAERDWQPHERASRERCLQIVQRLGVPFVDLQPACEELAAHGLPVRVVPTDPYHPNDACSAALAAAAADAVLGAPLLRVVPDRVVVPPGGVQRLAVTGPFLANAVVEVWDCGAGALPAARVGPPIATARNFASGGNLAMSVPAPAGAPGSLHWRVVAVVDGDRVVASSRPTPLVVGR